MSATQPNTSPGRRSKTCCTGEHNTRQPHHTSARHNTTQHSRTRLQGAGQTLAVAGGNTPRQSQHTDEHIARTEVKYLLKRVNTRQSQHNTTQHNTTHSRAVGRHTIPHHTSEHISHNTRTHLLPRRPNGEHASVRSDTMQYLLYSKWALFQARCY